MGNIESYQITFIKYLGSVSSIILNILVLLIYTRLCY